VNPPVYPPYIPPVTPPADTTAPVITLTGQSVVNVVYGAEYSDEGVTIKDNVDTELKAVLTYTKDGETSKTIDTSAAGSYIIHYNVSDAAGNPAVEVTREVIVAELGIGNAATLNELLNALDADAVKTINIKKDIDDIGATIVVDRVVTIDGGDHLLTFATDFSGLANGERQGILVSADGVTINDLKVAISHKDGWQGAYGIQVYDATGVVINNYTGTGADAALLVNGSDVELTGETTVSGNEFGGIEVSRGSEATADSVLTVTGTLVNDTEEYKKPTIWLVNRQGTVLGEGAPATTNDTAVSGQTQYYITSSNGTDPDPDSDSE